MDYMTITPYEGVDNIKFEMLSPEIRVILGEPVKVEINNIRKEVTEQMQGMVLRYKQDKLADIEISKHVPLKLMGIDIFGDPNSVIKLKELSKEIIEVKSDINFVDLGVLLSGFTGKKPKKDKFALAYSKARFEFYKIYMSVI